LAIAIIRISISIQQMSVARKYLEAFLDAGGAGNKNTENMLRGFRNEFDTFVKKNKPHQEFGWPYSKARTLWEFLKAMLDDEVIMSPADVTQACGLISALALQLDSMSDI